MPAHTRPAQQDNWGCSSDVVQTLTVCQADFDPSIRFPMMVAVVPEPEDGIVINSSCPECIRLWREYAAETIAHVKADSILKLAVLRHDAEAIILAGTLAEQILAEREAPAKRFASMRPRGTSAEGPLMVVCASHSGNMWARF